MLYKHLVFALALSLFSHPLYAGYLQNFNDPNTSHLIQALENKTLHVVQFGDSHTASDQMTDAMRTQLQSALGNGGLGWAMPMYFNGQRMALYGYDNNHWQPISSQTDPTENYTLGGLIAQPKQDNATLSLKPKRFTPLQNFTVSIRQGAQDGQFIGVDAQGHTFKLEAPKKDNTWHTVQFTAQLPFTITAQNTAQSTIGAWWGRTPEQTGAIVSAIGLNGATSASWKQWNPVAVHQELATISPHLVILAYGTDEIFKEKTLNISSIANTLRHTIQQIRQASPQTAILILSTPEILINTDGECGTRPTQLTALQNMQLHIAQSEKTLFWNWQDAMGGRCSMKAWMNQKLVDADGVHFDTTRYHDLGRLIANDILDIQSTPIQPTTDPLHTIETESQGFAQICLEGASVCRSISF